MNAQKEIEKQTELRLKPYTRRLISKIISQTLKEFVDEVEKKTPAFMTYEMMTFRDDVIKLAREKFGEVR